MSLVRSETLTCPNCGTSVEVDQYFSVNGDRRPDLTEEILNGRLQISVCGNCGSEFRAEPSINFLSVGDGLWLMARPLRQLAHWDEEETAATAAFNDAYGTNAPEAAREIGDTLKVRLTFGWPALREKILIAQAGLDDVAVESMKLAILRNRPGNPLAPGVELRLTKLRDTAFEMAWVEAVTNRPVELFEAARALYDEVGSSPEWSKIRDTLSAGCFVDIARMFIEPQPSPE